MAMDGFYLIYLESFLFEDPVKQIGEGNFRLGDVKMVETTDDYYSVDM